MGRAAALAARPPAARWTFVGGKGGVGKTTVAAALAVRLADAGEPTLAVSVDPAHSLGDALGVALGADPRPVPGAAGLRAMELDAELERTRWLARHRATLAALLERGTYLDDADVASLLDLAPPGVDELAAMLRLMALARERDAERCVIDTAPTGHTLRLLDTPRLIESWLDALGSLDGRHRAVREAFAPRDAGAAGVGDVAAADLAALRADARELGRRLRDPGHTRVVLVTTAEPVVLAETARYAAALAALGVATGAVVLNRAAGDGRDVTLPAAPMRLALPRLPRDPRGPAALRAAAAAMRAIGEAPAPAPAATADVEDAPPLAVGAAWSPPTDRRLYVVGGKGGVGKSSFASALAATLAATLAERAGGDGGRVLLLSVDPAGSLGELWEAPVGARPAPAPGLPRLELRQVDAAAAWDAFRDELRASAERLVTEVAGGADAFARDVLELTPPGLDELMALAELVDLAEARSYVAIVLDTAPTGHLLRLLAAPALALQWAHAAMRLLLRYRDVVGLGETAERLLRFTRGVHALQALLQDPARRHVSVVALPEALSVPETERLLARLRAQSLAPELLVVNRLLDSEGGTVRAAASRGAALLALPDAPPAVAAPALAAGPRGAAALLAFGRALRHISLPAPASSPLAAS